MNFSMTVCVTHGNCAVLRESSSSILTGILQKLATITCRDFEEQSKCINKDQDWLVDAIFTVLVLVPAIIVIPTTNSF